MSVGVDSLLNTTVTNGVCSYIIVISDICGIDSDIYKVMGGKMELEDQNFVEKSEDERDNHIWNYHDEIKELKKGGLIL